MRVSGKAARDLNPRATRLPGQNKRPSVNRSLERVETVERRRQLENRESRNLFPLACRSRVVCTWNRIRYHVKKQRRNRREEKRNNFSLSQKMEKFLSPFLHSYLFKSLRNKMTNDLFVEDFVEDRRLEIKLFIKIHLFPKISFLSSQELFFFSDQKLVQKLFPQSSAFPIEAATPPPPPKTHKFVYY